MVETSQHLINVKFLGKTWILLKELDWVMNMAYWNSLHVAIFVVKQKVIFCQLTQLAILVYCVCYLLSFLFYYSLYYFTISIEIVMFWHRMILRKSVKLWALNLWCSPDCCQQTYMQSKKESCYKMR